jgi:hypothetical protein
MKKILIAGLLLAATPVLAKQSVNPNIEGRSKEECNVHGCSLVCKGPSTDPYVRVSKIDKAEIILMKSGTMIFDLKRFDGDMKVIVPDGTESCSLRNIR